MSICHSTGAISICSKPPLSQLQSDKSNTPSSDLIYHKHAIITRRQHSENSSCMPPRPCGHSPSSSPLAVGLQPTQAQADCMARSNACSLTELWLWRYKTVVRSKPMALSVFSEVLLDFRFSPTVLLPYLVLIRSITGRDS